MVRVHSYMHLYMHPEGVHPAMEPSNDCITKIGVQRYTYDLGGGWDLIHTAPMLNMSMRTAIANVLSHLTLPYLTLNLSITKH